MQTPAVYAQPVKKSFRDFFLWRVLLYPREADNISCPFFGLLSRAPSLLAAASPFLFDCWPTPSVFRERGERATPLHPPPSLPSVSLFLAATLVCEHKPGIVFSHTPALVFLARGLPSFRLLLPAFWQRAFDPVSRSVVHMTPLPESLPAAILHPAGNDASDRAAALAFLGEHRCVWAPRVGALVRVRTMCVSRVPFFAFRGLVRGADRAPSAAPVEGGTSFGSFRDASGFRVYFTPLLFADPAMLVLAPCAYSVCVLDTAHMHKSPSSLQAGPVVLCRLTKAD